MTETAVSIPAKLRKLAALRAKRHAEQTRQWALDCIERYSKYMAEEAKKADRAEEEAAKAVGKWAEAIAKLKAAGFKVETKDYTLDIVVRTTEKKLTRVYKAIGRLDPETVCKELADAEKELVKVSIDSAHYPRVTVVYHHKLRPNDKCRIEKVEVPAKTEYQLVCGR